MRVLTHRIMYPSRSDVYRIVPIGDIHFGNALCDEQMLIDLVAEIKRQPNTYWGGGGDYCDFINRSDRRFQESQLAPWLHGRDDIVGAQIERLTEILGPIKDKCLWLARGNHEDQVLKKYERDVYYELCQRLGSTDKRSLALGYRGFMRLRFSRRRITPGHGSTFTFVFFVHHGYGGGRLEGAKALKLGRLPKNYRADVYLYGHDHSRMAFPTEQLRVAGKADRVVSRIVWGCTTGTFLRSYDPGGKLEVYSEERNLPPQPTGYINIFLCPEHRTVQVRM